MKGPSEEQFEPFKKQNHDEYYSLSVRASNSRSLVCSNRPDRKSSLGSLLKSQAEGHTFNYSCGNFDVEEKGFSPCSQYNECNTEYFRKWQDTELFIIQHRRAHLTLANLHNEWAARLCQLLFSNSLHVEKLEDVGWFAVIYHNKNAMSFLMFLWLSGLFEFVCCICAKRGHLSRLHANEMLIYLNDLLYLRREKA